MRLEVMQANAATPPVARDYLRPNADRSPVSVLCFAVRSRQFSVAGRSERAILNPSH
jgi:hypothetical protein